VLAEGIQVGGEIGGRAESVGVVVAQDPAPPDQGVLVQFPRPLFLTQLAQVDSEVVGGGEGCGVVLSQHPPRAG
jgi:hypothetical protein